MKNEIYKDYQIDFDDEIIIPETIWGEFVYIWFILVDIWKNRQDAKNKMFHLKRQIYFFIKWLKNK